MIIDIGTEIDEAVIRWKHKETDEWQRADIDELIDVYENIVRCKDCEYWNNETDLTYCDKGHWYGTDADDYCSFAKMKGGAYDNQHTIAD